MGTIFIESKNGENKMTKFKKKVEKKYSLRLSKKVKAALASLKGFDFYLAGYKNAGSYDKALEMFFENLLRDLRDLTRVFKVESSISPKLFKKNLDEFVKRTANVLMEYVEDLLEISKQYDLPQEVKKREELQIKMKKFGSSVDIELKKLGERVDSFLSTAKLLDLKIEPQILHALNVWSKMTFKSFFKMLKAGRIDWIK